MDGLLWRLIKGLITSHISLFDVDDRMLAMHNARLDEKQLRLPKSLRASLQAVSDDFGSWTSPGGMCLDWVAGRPCPAVAKHEGHADPEENGQSACRSAFVGPYKMDSIVRHLGVALEGACTISETIKI